MSDSFYGVSSWYSTLADHTFPATFVKLKESDLGMIVRQDTESPEAKILIKRIKSAQARFSGATFVFADNVAPTDTVRFKEKKGAVHSAESAWKNLIGSKKIRGAAAEKEFEYICVRPYRNMSHPREFRLFIYNGELKGMSQYLLDRAYKRLFIKKDLYWSKAKKLISEISWLLPDKNITLDIYFTSGDEILLLDFNAWGGVTNPLLFKAWNVDWNREYGIIIM